MPVAAAVAAAVLCDTPGRPLQAVLFARYVEGEQTVRGGGSRQRDSQAGQLAARKGRGPREEEPALETRRQNAAARNPPTDNAMTRRRFMELLYHEAGRAWPLRKTPERAG